MRALRNVTLRLVPERCLARILAARGELLRALELYETVLDDSIRADVPIMLACESLGVDLAAAGHHDLAATIFGALETDPNAHRGIPIVGRPAAIEALRLAMGETRFDESVARGRVLDVDQLGPFVHAALTRIIADLRTE